MVDFTVIEGLKAYVAKQWGPIEAQSYIAKAQLEYNLLYRW